MASRSIIAGENGLSIGQELTFFYPSTEWDMAQGFDCFCGTKTCRGFISGAKNMTSQQLEGIWLNPHIRELLKDEKAGLKNDVGEGRLPKTPTSLLNGQPGTIGKSRDATEEALIASLEQAKKMVESAQKALDIYMSIHGETRAENGTARYGARSREVGGEMRGDTRRGVTSREMSGEMGGDTSDKNGVVRV
jgi:hypothetical protein